MKLRSKLASATLSAIFVCAACTATAQAPKDPPPMPEGKFQVMGKSLWVIMTRAVEGAPQSMDAMEAHMKHQMRLESEGIMYGAGPLSDADGNRAGGMIIIRADNKEEAIKIADADPMHANGLREYDLLHWTMNEGHMDISLDFSKGTFTLK